MKKFLLLLAAVGMIFTACEGGEGLEEENNGTPSKPKIELLQQNIEVEFDPAQYAVEVTSPYSWEAISKNDWVVVETKTGVAGTKVLKFSVERNDELEIREGTIVIKNEDYSLVAELYITQKAFVPAITIEPESLTFAYKGSIQEVAIIANFEYEWLTNSDWLNIEKSEKGVKVAASNHAEVENRTAEITISSEKYGISKVVKVMQEAFAPEITISSELLEYGFEGGKQELLINSNCDYNIVEDYEWITTEKKETGLNLIVEASTITEARKAEIVVSNEKYGISKKVMIKQKAFEPILLVEDISVLEFDYTGELKSVKIDSNFDYLVVTDVSWITWNKTSNGINITLSVNTDTENIRNTVIKIYSSEYNVPTKSIHITQTTYPVENILYYTTASNSMIEIESFDFDANIVENIYKDNIGVVKFDAIITSIGAYSFAYTDLRSVIIPTSVMSIGSGAFKNTLLSEICIPNNVAYIGDRVFENCSSLRSVSIGKYVRTIGDMTFYGCNNINKVIIADLSVWCKINFGGTSANPLCHKSAKLYLNGSELTDITIPSDITEIKNYTFTGYSSLTSVTIGNGVTSIGQSAFSSCWSLTNVTIPDSATSIGKWAFCDCASLTSVTIGNGVISIGELAFKNCTSLTSVIIGQSVAAIGNKAFDYCDSLILIYCKPALPPAIGYEYDSYYSKYIGTFPSNLEMIIYVPRESYSKYKQYSSYSSGHIAQNNWYAYKSYIHPYDFE